MKPAMRKLGFASCCIAGILLGLYATYVYYGYRTRPALTFEKDFVDLREQTTFEGEVIRIQNNLINNSSRGLEIKGIPASCGCLAISRNDKPLSYPLRLSPKSRLPLDIKIYTQGRFSEQLVTARAEAFDENGERHESLPLQITFKVISRVFVIPYDPFVKVKVPDKEVRPVRQTFLIASRGEPCIKLTIETAHKQQFKFDVKKVNGTVDYNGLALNKCFEVDLCYLPAQGAETFSETLQFIPDDQPALAKSVRFDGIIEYPYRLEPERLVILRACPKSRVR